MSTSRRPKRSPSLSAQAIAGLVAGLLVALIFGEHVAWLRTVGMVFISVLQIALLPYLMGSLIVALGSLSIERAKAISVYAGSILLAFWAVAISTVLLMSVALPRWTTASFFSTASMHEQSQPNLIQLFIPSNPFYALANGVVPAVVVFSILLAVSLMRQSGKEAVIAPLKVLTQALMGITRMVTQIAPYGIFAVTAGTAATVDLSDLAKLQVYMVTYTVASLVLGLWLLPALIAAMTPLRFADVSRELRAPILTAFATSSVTITLPLIIAAAQQLMDQHRSSTGQTTSDKDSEQESPVEILVPAAFNFPDIAQVLALFFVAFGGWYVGSRLTAVDSLEAIAIGLPSLFGGRSLTIPILLGHFGLPRDLFQLFVTAEVIVGRLGALLGAAHLAAIALLGTFAMQRALIWRPAALIRLVLKTALLLVFSMLAIRAFYTYVVVAPYTKDQALRSLKLPIEPRSPTVITQAQARSAAQAEGLSASASFSQIRKRGTIRYCFLNDEYPRSFLNSASPRELVGFDVEMGLRFARELTLKAEFVPTETLDEVSQLLGDGACDLLISSQLVHAGAVERFALSTPVYQSAAGILTLDAKGSNLSRWVDIQGPKVPRLALMSGDISFARAGLLNARLTTIEDNRALRALLESKAPGIDGIAMPSEVASALSLLYPDFSVVVPKPVASLQMAYAVAPGNDSLLRVLDAWIISERAAGTIDLAYSYWMAGGAFKSSVQPRWSVIRNVLRWVD